MGDFGWLPGVLISMTLTHPNSNQRDSEFAAKPLVEEVAEFRE
jgi:hypothetical protein